jgi:hypothetical protein
MVKLIKNPQVNTVLLVPLTEKVSQPVPVQEDTSKAVLKLVMLTVMSVETNVLLVILMTTVQNVTTDMFYSKTCVT